MRYPSLATIVLTSYGLAAISFGVNRPPWGLVAQVPVLEAVVNGPMTGIVMWSSLLTWCAAATFAFWRFRLKAWPIVLGAPFALYLPLEMGLLVGLCVFA